MTTVTYITWLKWDDYSEEESYVTYN